MHRFRLILLAGVLGGTSGVALAAPPPDSPEARQEAKQLDQLPPVKPARAGHLDHSGRKQEGHASYYGPGFVQKKMADGRKMNPSAEAAASKTLPLGSVAEVTNLRNGKSTTVRIEDRGPYVDGRIIDLTPKAAGQIDMKHEGVAPVVVKPITVPTPDGGVKLGAGAADADEGKLADAVETTEKMAAPAAASNTAR